MKVTSFFIGWSVILAVSAQDFDSIVDSALSVASSWASANDVNSIVSSFASEAGLTDISNATSLLASITEEFLPDTASQTSDADGTSTSSLAQTITSASITDEASPVESISSSDDESAAQATTTSANAGVADWSTPIGAIVASFFFGIAIYL